MIRHIYGNLLERYSVPELPGYSPRHQIRLSAGADRRAGNQESTFIRIMGKDWYSESLKVSDMKDKTAAEKLLGSWVIEISEMDGMNTTKADTLKSFLSAQQDKYRPAYGRKQ